CRLFNPKSAERQFRYATTKPVRRRFDVPEHQTGAKYACSDDERRNNERIESVQDAKQNPDPNNVDEIQGVRNLPEIAEGRVPEKQAGLRVRHAKDNQGAADNPVSKIRLVHCACRRSERQIVNANGEKGVPRYTPSAEEQNQVQPISSDESAGYEKCT